MKDNRQTGRLVHRVNVLERTAELDDLGRQSRATTWTAVKTNVPAEVKELSGRELELAKQIHAESNHVVRLRYSKAYNTKHRLTFRNRTLEIKAIVDSDHSRRELLLFCGETK